MSTFRRRYLVAVDGGEYEVMTRPADFLGAERDIAFEEIRNVTEIMPLYLQTRVVWRAWRRANPEHPLGHDFAKFAESLEEMDDLDAETDGPPTLTPTLPADTASSP